MKYLFKILMLFFSLGILIYPAQNNISQNSKVMSCCTANGVCHKDLPQKNHKKSESQNCCNTTVSIVQFIKQNEIISPVILQKNTFNKLSFFYSNSILPNTLLEGIWQPPKFI